MNLLIADDEMLIRKGLLSLNWSSIGIDEVYSASNGNEVEELLLSEHIDLAMLDIRMPGKSGLELAELVQRHSLDTAIILLTGFSDFEYARQALRSGVFEYILKPIYPREILETVDAVQKRLKERRYRDQMVREHQNQPEIFDVARQIHNHFAKVSPSISEVLEEMAQEYPEPITLEQMAERHHFSSTYLSRKIKQEAGYSFIEILRAIRLTNAAVLLQQGEKINQVSYKTGFRDQRYFSQAFRSVFKCSPSEFKKQENAEVHFFEVMQAVAEKRSGAGHEE